jgi:hypothetical protein
MPKGGRIACDDGTLDLGAVADHPNVAERAHNQRDADQRRVGELGRVDARHQNLEQAHEALDKRAVDGRPLAGHRLAVAARLGLHQQPRQRFAHFRRLLGALGADRQHQAECRRRQREALANETRVENFSGHQQSKLSSSFCTSMCLLTVSLRSEFRRMPCVRRVVSSAPLALARRELPLRVRRRRSAGVWRSRLSRQCVTHTHSPTFTHSSTHSPRSPLARSGTPHQFAQLESQTRPCPMCFRELPVLSLALCVTHSLTLTHSLTHSLAPGPSVTCSRARRGLPLQLRLWRRRPRSKSHRHQCISTTTSRRTLM